MITLVLAACILAPGVPQCGQGMVFLPAPLDTSHVQVWLPQPALTGAANGVTIGSREW